ncbi:MAG TPA: DUF4870 domain-containing protein [Pyrinomonadaceae bacterium]|nr:DUF4870 domain-containing protein [Pyrinomonadaceae bacterium]
MQNMSGGKTALGLDTNVGALLVYMPVCAISLIYSIIVLVTEKNDRFMRFHAFQSLLITAIYIVALIAVSILGSMIGIITGSSVLASLFSLLMFVVIVIFLAAMIYGCIKGYQGEKFKFPVVGDMAEKWAG